MRVIRKSNFDYEDHRGDQYFVAQRLTRQQADLVAETLNSLERSPTLADCRDATLAAHRTVCPERPVKVGDYVRWERYGAASWNWAEGEVIEIEKSCTRVLVQAQAPDRVSQLGPCWLGTNKKYWGGSLRRVPRPAATEAQAAAEARPVEARTAAARTAAAQNALQAAAEVLAAKKADEARAAEARAPEETPEATVPPVELVDGWTRNRCADRWHLNQCLVEVGSAPYWQMTPAQIDAGRRAYTSRNSPDWSTRLREKVAASAAADAARRPSVRVTPEFDPWD